MARPEAGPVSPDAVDRRDARAAAIRPRFAGRAPVRPRLEGLACVAPDPRMSASEALAFAVSRLPVDDVERLAARVARMHAGTGIESRGVAPGTQLDELIPVGGREPGTAARMSAYDACAGRLAIEAGRRALAGTSVASSAITHLVTVSCTGGGAPGIDLEMIEALGLPRDVARTHVGFMGCHGALNGLRAAAAFAAADPSAIVLIGAVEVCSVHFATDGHPQRLIANALFADGAAAGVVRGSPQHGDADAGWTVAAQASDVVPGTRDLMSWRIGDAGFAMTLDPRVPAVIEPLIGPWVRAWLDRDGLHPDDVDHWIVHPGGPRILDAAERGLGLVPGALDASRRVLRRHGNMSSPTVFFGLDDVARGRGPLALGGGDTERAVLLGFGPGLAIEACRLERRTGPESAGPVRVGGQ